MNLTPSQEIIAKDRHRFRVVCSGRRFGKTVLAVYEMIAKALSKKDQNIGYIAPTYQQARDIAWELLKKTVEPVKLSINESRLEIVIKAQTWTPKNKHSSKISLRGWESVETLRGQQFSFIVIDEIAQMRNFEVGWQEVIRPTLTDTRGECLFISTPKGFNHFYDLFMQEKEDLDYKSYHFTSYDNPHIPPDELEKAKLEIPEDRFAQEYMADFRKTEGLVYKAFDRTRHVYPVRMGLDMEAREPQINRNETLVGLDFGFTNPACALTILRDNDDHYWVTQEWYKTGKTSPEIIEYVKTQRPNAVYPDPAEPDRIQEMIRNGINCREVSKDIPKGIDCVRELFKQNRIHIHKDCKNLIFELETYAYPDKKDKNNLDERPIKENDHAVDALRYALYMNAGRTRREVRQWKPSFKSKRKK